jgi:hypothetical protein
MSIRKGNKTVTRRALVSAKSRDAAIERAKLKYPPFTQGGRYFDHRCPNPEPVR